MMSSKSLIEKASARQAAGIRRWTFAIIGIIVLGLGGGVYSVVKWFGRPAEMRDRANVEPSGASVVGHRRGGDFVHLARDKWSVAGLETAPVVFGALAESTWVTGKIALNEERLAHVYPLVEGVVREVKVHFGQEVTAGDVLTVLDSKEVGTAKLELVKNRLAVEFAQINQRWSQTIQENTDSLIKTLDENVPVLEIEERFRDQAMGDYREQLVASYARLNQARADFERIKALYEMKTIAGREFIKAKADFEAATATYEAKLEWIKFASRQQLVAANQKCKEAMTSRSVTESLLLILGYREDEVAQMDPLKQGDQVAHYSMTAPLSGTVIKKDVVLLEHVVPQMQLFQIADLSTIWIHADIFEKDLSLLESLKGKTLDFRAAAYPGRKFEANVTYTGDIVEEQTRAIRLIATADNPEKLLKPGMFVEVRLPKVAATNALLVPESAVQQHAGDLFVFVQRKDDEFGRRRVVRGRAFDGMVEIISGVNEGDNVVIKGGFALKSEMLRELMTEE